MPLAQHFNILFAKHEGSTISYQVPLALVALVSTGVSWESLYFEILC